MVLWLVGVCWLVGSVWNHLAAAHHITKNLTAMTLRLNSQTSGGAVGPLDQGRWLDARQAEFAAGFVFSSTESRSRTSATCSSVSWLLNASISASALSTFLMVSSRKVWSSRK